MIDIQTVACFNTRSPILHLFLPIQCQIHNIPSFKDVFNKKTSLFGLVNTYYGHFI